MGLTPAAGKVSGVADFGACFLPVIRAFCPSLSKLRLRGDASKSGPFNTGEFRAAASALAALTTERFSFSSASMFDIVRWTVSSSRKGAYRLTQFAANIKKVLLRVVPSFIHPPRTTQGGSLHGIGSLDLEFTVCYHTCTSLFTFTYVKTACGVDDGFAILGILS